MPEPLFIICPGRSFSSVVCACVGQHPEAFGVPELNLFMKDTVGELIDLDMPVLGIPGLSTGLRRTLAELMHGEQTDDTIAKVDEWLAKHRKWTGARMFRELMEMTGGKLIVDKTPSNTASKALARMIAAFPDAYYLHLSRNPRATIKSKRKAAEKRKRTQRLVDGAFNDEGHWFDRHRTLAAVGQQMAPGQYMFLKGEWFFEDPEMVMGQICEWLGLSTAPEAITRMMSPEASPFAVKGPESARHGNNPGFLENPTLRIGKIPEPSMKDPLEWITDREVHFRPDTKTMAHQLGYAE